MESKEALRYVVNHSGKSQRAISVELGKVPTYISATFTQGSIPTVETLANVANVCGYDLLLVNRETGETISIDPACQDDLGNRED